MMDFHSSVQAAEQIAIIRSSYPRHLDDALKIIRGINPRIRINVIVMPRMAPPLKDNPNINELIILPADHDTYPAAVAENFLDSVRKKELPLIVILYNRANQIGYTEVERLVMSFQPRHTWGMTTTDDFFRLSGFYRFRRACKRFGLALIMAPVMLPLILFLRFLAFYTRWETGK